MPRNHRRQRVDPARQSRCLASPAGADALMGAFGPLTFGASVAAGDCSFARHGTPIPFRPPGEHTAPTFGAQGAGCRVRSSRSSPVSAHPRRPRPGKIVIRTRCIVHTLGPDEHVFSKTRRGEAHRFYRAVHRDCAASFSPRQRLRRGRRTTAPVYAATPGPTGDGRGNRRLEREARTSSV